MTSPLRTRVLAVVSTAAILSLGLAAAPAAATPGIPIITGHVTSGGADVEGLVIQGYPDDFSDPIITDTTAADGTYHLDDVPDASYTVQIFDPASDWMYEPGVPVTIVGGAATVVDFDLDPWPVGTSVVHGVLTDSATSLPIGFETVSFNGSGTAKDATATTDVDGNFSFIELPGGFYSLYVGVAGYVSKFVPFTLDENDDLELNIAVTPANATISGTVTDASSDPVPDGLWVSYQLDSDPSISGGTTTSGGEYSFPDIGAGTYTVSMGGPGTDWMAASQSVVAVADATTPLNFVLDERVSSNISGTIWNAAHTATLAKICVTAYDSTGVAVGGAGMSGTTSDGTYTVEDLEGGDYRLHFWDCDYTRVPAYAMTFFGGSASLTNATAITLAGGVDQTGKDMLLDLGGTIAGHINVQAADSIVELPTNRGMDATVFHLVNGVWEAMPDPSPFVGAGEVGDYQASGLPAGTYRVGFVDGITAGVRAYATEYWDDSPTIATAQNVAVAAGSTTSGINATVRIPRPGDAPAAVATADLTSDEEGDIASDGSAAQGETIEVEVDPDLAGEWVSIWGHSTPVLMGDWVQVSASGTVTVPVSTSMPTGAHQLVAQDAEGNVLGWTPIEIAAGSTSTTGLASTGSALVNSIALGAATLLLLAVGVVLVHRRRHA